MRLRFCENTVEQASRDLGVVLIGRRARHLSEVVAVPARQDEQARIGEQPRQLDRVFEMNSQICGCAPSRVVKEDANTSLRTTCG